MSTAVLLLAYGGPNSPDDLPAYISDVRHGRPTPPALLQEITRRYQLIGGLSPLLEITQRTARGLSDETKLPVYVGMRHWHPYIRETVAEMARDGITHLVAICLAPHYSEMSIGAYRALLDTALSETAMTCSFVESWHTQPDYLAGIAENVRATRLRFTPRERAHLKLVFTAHSLPAALCAQGDPYDAQLRETATLLAHELQLRPEEWLFSYQSAPKVDLPWLGPQIEELVPQLAARGETNLLIAPIGFVAEHVEILYDLDIGVQEIARAHHVHVERTPMLNAGPALIAALAALVRQALERAKIKELAR